MLFDYAAGICLDKVRILMVEQFVPPREQIHAEIRFDPDSAIAVEFDLFCGVRRYVALRMRFWLGRHTRAVPDAT